MRDFKNPYVNQKIMATVQNLICNNCNPGNGPNANTNYNYRFIDGFLQTTKSKGISLYRTTNNITGWEKLNAAENGNEYP